MRLSAIALCAVIGGCASMPGMPGYVSEETSTFDGARTIAVAEGNAGTFGLALGARWRSSAPEYVQIVAKVVGEYAAIEDRGGLEFNADGRIIRLDATRYPTQHEAARGVGTVVYRSSSKAFLMRRDDFQSILRAGSLKVRLHTLSGYMESDMLSNASTPGAAIDGFRSLGARLP